MNKENINIHNFLNCIKASIPYLEQELRVNLTIEEILVSLVTESGKDIKDLCTVYTTKEKLFDNLKHSKLVKSKPQVLETITIEECIIPEDTIRDLNEELVRHKGEIWHIHKNDADPFPSNPHAHNYAAGLKLDLRNGDLYLRKEKVNKLKKKDFLALRDKFKCDELPALEV